MNLRASAAAKLYFKGSADTEKVYSKAERFCKWADSHYPEVQLYSSSTTEALGEFFEIDNTGAHKWVWNARYIAVKYPELYEEWKNEQA